jgi:hypothetical protein
MSNFKRKEKTMEVKGGAEMQEYSQEDKMFLYFNVYLQGGDVPADLKAEFAEFELARTGLPKEPVSDDLNSQNEM